MLTNITKKEIAMQLDKGNPLFNFSCETGKTSYHNYTRDQLLEICAQFKIDPESDYHKRRRGVEPKPPQRPDQWDGHSQQGKAWESAHFEYEKKMDDLHDPADKYDY